MPVAPSLENLSADFFKPASFAGSSKSRDYSRQNEGLNYVYFFKNPNNAFHNNHNSENSRSIEKGNNLRRYSPKAQSDNAQLKSDKSTALDYGASPISYLGQQNHQPSSYSSQASGEVQLSWSHRVDANRYQDDDIEQTEKKAPPKSQNVLACLLVLIVFFFALGAISLGLGLHYGLALDPIKTTAAVIAFTTKTASVKTTASTTKTYSGTTNASATTTSSGTTNASATTATPTTLTSNTSTGPAPSSLTSGGSSGIISTIIAISSISPNGNSNNPTSTAVITTPGPTSTNAITTAVTSSATYISPTINSSTDKSTSLTTTTSQKAPG